MFDIAQIRAQFPILSREINGKPLVYLDSAASAQKPESVINAMGDFMRTSYANVHRGIHTLSNEATAAYESARKSLANFIGAMENEIVFTKGTTEGINLIAHSVGETLAEGDEIIITELEHHANIVPWYMLSQRKGVKLRFADINDDGSLNIEHFQSLLNSNTKLVAFAHISNVLGTRIEIEEMTRLAHAIGAKVLIDGAQGIVHEKIDVKAIDCDFYVFSGHKLYGPSGIGAVYGKSEILNNLPPFLGGGEMIEHVSKEEITYNEAPFRFEAGTPPITESVGLKAAIDFLNKIDRGAVLEHENRLYDIAAAELRKRNHIRIFGETKNKAPILTFAIDGIHPHDISQILDKYGVAIRAGHHCAQPLMQRLGVSATARASFGLYNTENEIDIFLHALDKAIQLLR